MIGPCFLASTFMVLSMYCFCLFLFLVCCDILTRIVMGKGCIIILLLIHLLAIYTWLDAG